MNQLLKAQADNLTNTFQAQIQALQDKISQQSQPAPKPSRRSHEQYEGDNPFEDRRTFSMEDIMGKDFGQSKPNNLLKEFAIYNRALAKARRAKEDQRVNKLADAFANMDLNDE